MSVFSNHMMMAAALASDTVAGYTIDNSCIWNDGDAAYLHRTPDSDGNLKTWTFSGWFKRGSRNNRQSVLSASTSQIDFQALTDDHRLAFNISGIATIYSGSTGIDPAFDPTAWYHCMWVWDSTQGTQLDRTKFYINGSQVTASLISGPGPSENHDWVFNDASNQMRLGYYGSVVPYDGYMAEIIMVDGSALTPSSFGETNEKGVWVPIDPSGLTFGSQGFWLDFESSGDLGNDVSGNNNDFTNVNLVASDQSTDTPTNNHCVWNIADKLESTITLSEGNKNFLNSAGSQDSAKGTFFPTTGKWYWEVKWEATSSVDGGLVGISQCDVQSNHELGSTDNQGTGDSLGYRSSDGKTYRNSTLATFGDTWDVGDVISVAMDLDNGKVYFGKNNTWQNSGDPTSGSTGTGAAYTISSTLVNGGGWGPAVCNEASALFEARFAEEEWSYDAPANFLALNTTNLAAPVVTDPSTNFQVVTYTGNSSTQSITLGGNSNMKPDLVWAKSRSNADSHVFQDAARGVGKALFWNNADTEDAVTDAVTSFDTDGFSLGDGSELSTGTINTTSRTYVAWNWAAGNTGASNTDGTINTTTTYVNTTAGISIGTYTGTGSGATVGHGLGVTPTTVWIFPRSNGDNHLASNWETGISVYSEKWKLQDSEVAESSANHVTGASSTTFTLGTNVNVNGSSRTYVAYSFVEVVGFSKFGTYTGNDETSGPYAFCGFAPEMVMIKADVDGEDWIIFDRVRDTSNPAENYLYPNTDAAEATSSTQKIDFLSNGFKPRGTDNRINGNDTIHIFAAFAKHPFGGDGVSPSTAVT